jgi:hypothetical protein
MGIVFFLVIPMVFFTRFPAFEQHWLLGIQLSLYYPLSFLFGRLLGYRRSYTWIAPDRVLVKEWLFAGMPIYRTVTEWSVAGIENFRVLPPFFARTCDLTIRMQDGSLRTIRTSLFPDDHSALSAWADGPLKEGQASSS